MKVLHHVRHTALFEDPVEEGESKAESVHAAVAIHGAVQGTEIERNAFGVGAI